MVKNLKRKLEIIIIIIKGPPGLLTAMINYISILNLNDEGLLQTLVSNQVYTRCLCLFSNAHVTSKRFVCTGRG